LEEYEAQEDSKIGEISKEVLQAKAISQTIELGKRRQAKTKHSKVVHKPPFCDAFLLHFFFFFFRSFVLTPILQTTIPDDPPVKPSPVETSRTQRAKKEEKREPEAKRQKSAHQSTASPPETDNAKQETEVMRKASKKG
jgi:hypothetical protein